MILKDIRQRPTAFLAMILLVCLGVRLGIWQLDRANQKEHLAIEIAEKAKLTPLDGNSKDWTLSDAQYHQITVEGRWLPEKGVWLENRPHPLGRDPKTGIATGMFLLMPLELLHEPQKVVWVNRGWAPRSFMNLNEVPKIQTPIGKIQITGIVYPDATKTLQIQGNGQTRATDGLRIIQNLLLEEVASKESWKQLPFVIRQTSKEEDTQLDQSLGNLDLGINMHLGYAFQWFGLAGMTFIFWVFSGYRKRFKSLR